MKSKFISTGLASAGRSLQVEKNEASLATAQPSTNHPPAVVTTDLDSLVRKEQAKLQVELLQKECAEFHKHRQALLPELREAINGQQAALQSVEGQVETLIRVHEDLEVAVLPTASPVSLTELREAKRNLDAARMELLKIQRAQTPGQVPHRAAIPDTGIALATLTQLTFRQATWLGLSLAWPLIAALLLGALFIGICLLSVFKG